MEAHTDQTPLVAALDAWFGVLRRRTGAPIPLKPAKRRDLDVLSSALGLELPPDVVALYEYSNGVWRDRKTQLDVFIPNWGRFRPINRHVYSSTWEIGEEGISGPGFDDLPGRDYELHIPIIDFDGGEQLSVMSAPSCYQAVAYYSLDASMWWPARRLSEFISFAVKLESSGLLDWEGGVPTIRQSGRPYPFDLDLVGSNVWRWEPLGGAAT